MLYLPSGGGGVGSTPVFKWQRWPNTGKNQPPPPPQGFQQNSNKFLVRPKVNPKNPCQISKPSKFPEMIVLYWKTNMGTVHLGFYRKVSDCFEYPKNPSLNQAKKNSCQIFLPKQILESKLSNQKKSFDHPRHHLKSWVPTLGLCTSLEVCIFVSLWVWNTWRSAFVVWCKTKHFLLSP